MRTLTPEDHECPSNPPTKAPIPPRDLWSKWFPRFVQLVGVAIVLYEVATTNSVEAYGIALTLPVYIG